MGYPEVYFPNFLFCANAWCGTALPWSFARYLFVAVWIAHLGLLLEDRFFDHRGLSLDVAVSMLGLIRT
jgi:hypothetical protein